MHRVFKQFRDIAMATSLAMVACQAGAAVTVGGFTFADDAFADVLISSSGTFQTSGGSLASVLTDIDAATYAGSLTEGAFVELGFTDNALVNGTGVDLVLFELGVPAGLFVSLTVDGLANPQQRLFVISADTTFDAGGFNLNAAEIDLDFLGVAPGASLTSIAIRLDYTGDGDLLPPALSLVGALNSESNAAPEPTTLALLGLGLAGLASVRRRKH